MRKLNIVDDGGRRTVIGLLSDQEDRIQKEHSIKKTTSSRATLLQLEAMEYRLLLSSAFEVWGGATQTSAASRINASTSTSRTIPNWANRIRPMAAPFLAGTTPITLSPPARGSMSIPCRAPTADIRVLETAHVFRGLNGFARQGIFN